METIINNLSAPKSWGEQVTHSECSLHQLSPFIGKLKSNIAGDLIEKYSTVGDLVVDPFSGAGTIPLEAVLRGRRCLASDVSAYSKALTIGKIQYPKTVEQALETLLDIQSEAKSLPDTHLLRVPPWVRSFFNKKTLKETLKFAEVCRRDGNEFFMSCLLGILHHQRPGFLSFPSSHLVPYLRDKKYPKEKFPELYKYREVFPRLEAKVLRAYKRPPNIKDSDFEFIQSDVKDLLIPIGTDAIITSPPYMNALDYVRDNRLRLWLLDTSLKLTKKMSTLDQSSSAQDAIFSLINSASMNLKIGGYLVFIVADKIKSSQYSMVSKIKEAVNESAQNLKLENIIEDQIPDIRRARRSCRGVKKEMVLVFKKEY